MESLFKTEAPLPVIRDAEIFDFVLDGDDSHNPVVLNGKLYHLKMNQQGNWRIDGLSAEVGDYLGEIIENQAL